MSQSDKKFLIQIERILSELYPSAKIYLFGSRAKDFAHKESDWDWFKK